MDIIIPVIAGIVSFGSGFFIMYFRHRSIVSERMQESSKQVAVLEKEKEIISAEIMQKNNKISLLEEKVSTLDKAHTESQTRLDEMMKNFEEQKKLFAESTEKLKETFKALSSDALESSNDSFLKLAKSTFEKFVTEAQGDFQKREKGIKDMLNPFGDLLKDYRTKIDDIEKARKQAYGSLSTQLDQLSKSSENLKKETTTLSEALKNNRIRGRWGELSLRRVVENSGMTEHCDFEEQTHVGNEDGASIRPDMIVHLPDCKTIVIDAKVPLDDYLKAVESPSEEERNAYMDGHVKKVRKHVRDLNSKAYWSQFKDSPDFVVMFMPGESFFSAAVEKDGTLLEDSIKNRVILATPTTLIALLRTVAFAWQQHEVTENTEKILKTGKELYERMATFSQKFGDIRKHLNRTVDSFNGSVASWETRMLPSARKLQELKVSEKEVAEIEPVDSTAREVSKLTIE